MTGAPGEVVDTVMEYIQEALDNAPDSEARDDLRDEIVRRLQVDAGESLLARISRRIRAVYPTAVTLRAKGEWNEDMLLRLYPHQLLDAQGTSLDRADDPSDAWALFDDDDLYDDLVELAESDSSYEGETEIALA